MVAFEWTSCVSAETAIIKHVLEIPVLCVMFKAGMGKGCVAFWGEVDIRAPTCSVIRGLQVPLSCDSESEPDKGKKSVLAAW